MIDSTYEDKLYQTPTFAGAVRKLQTNELRNTVMLRLLRVNRLCSKTVSGTANRLKKHGRRNPLPFPFSQRSHVGNLRQTIQGKGVIHKRVETAGVYPLVRPRGVSALPAILHLNAKEEHCCLAVSLFAHITVFCFPDLSAVPHGGALLRSQEALSPALQRTRVSPGRCAYARDSRSYPRTDRAFSADD